MGLPLCYVHQRRTLSHFDSITPGLPHKSATHFDDLLLRRLVYKEEKFQ